MTKTDIFFALLRSALVGVPLSGEARQHLAAALPDVCRLASKHDALHLVAYALEREGISAEGALSDKLLREQMLAVYRYERQAYELSRITALLDGEGIAYVPLKGAVLRALYPEPYLRTSCDIDLLVPEASLPLAASLLKERLSYTSNDVRAYHDISLYSPSGVHLELHFSIKENIEPMDGVLSRVWDCTTPAEGARYDMSDEFLAFHLIAHAAYHFRSGGCGIRPFADLYLLLKKRVLSHEVLNGLLREAGLSAFGAAAIAFGEVHFDGKEASDTVRDMTAFLLDAGVYGQLENKVAIQGKSRGRYMLRRILLPKKTLESYYPALSRHAWLYPLFTLRRWLAILFVGKRRQGAMKELRLAATVDAEKQEQLLALTASLGLDF